MRLKNMLKNIGIGMAMGTADIIPGVSWWTIAFISGIYDTLITSIARIDTQLWKYLIWRKRKKARIYVQGTFLVQLFGGIIWAIVLLAHVMSYLLHTYPTYVFAFFFGLILASIILIAYQHLAQHLSTKTLCIVWWGVILWYVLTSQWTLHTTATPSLMTIFFTGACASIAMILPGISWSYILLLLGRYEYILETLKTQLHLIVTWVHQGSLDMFFRYETWVLVLFICGIIFWLLSFSKILHRLLHHHHTSTLALLIGFMVWSIHTVRPRSWVLTLWDRVITSTLFLWGMWLITVIALLSPTTKKTTS